MKAFDFNERVEIYNKALSTYGVTNQLVVAIEELSELQKEICKILREGGSLESLAEEVADATIMLEQLSVCYGMRALVRSEMTRKLERLIDRMEADSK